MEGQAAVVGPGGGPGGLGLPRPGRGGFRGIRLGEDRVYFELFGDMSSSLSKPWAYSLRL